MKVKNVLIVDDSKIILKINSNLCKEIGIENIFTAEDGKKGLELFKNTPNIDLVLTDINMPVMNGFELLEEIRKIDKNVKIFMCTTEGGREEVVKALRIGANNYIVKPVSREVLQNKIKEIM
jgi:two-component system, chemotaxis family, chemotaxis protein CheY